MKNSLFLSYFLVFALLITFYSPKLSAWGGRGHTHICEAASHLVQHPELKAFLQSRGHIVAHLCNIPDTYWRSLTGEARTLGDPTHFVDPEIIGVTLDKIDLNYRRLVKEFTQKPNKFKEGFTISSVPKEFGSVWWRGIQFFDLGRAEFKLASRQKPPGDRRQEQSEELLFNKHVYQGFVHLGLMGHFIGDAVQPLHLTADYDGYQRGHGGLHAYYEQEVVDELPINWTGQVHAHALKLKPDLMNKKGDKNFLTEKNLLKAFQLLSLESHKDTETLFKLDPIVEKSTIKDDKGLSLRTPAKRKPAKEVYKSFEPMIKSQMARSALYLARLWDEAYLNGRKNWPISKYKSYRYPFTPEFVAPDYFDRK